MKKEIYEAYLLVRYIGMTIAQVNSLTDYQRNWYVDEVEKYLKNK